MSTSKTCAVCDKAIGISYLMCATHWHSVPRELKTRVFRAWGHVERRRGDRIDQAERVREYRAVRDEAIAAARAAEAEPQGASKR